MAIPFLSNTTEPGVAISGGTLDGTVIGGNTPAAGSFTVAYIGNSTNGGVLNLGDGAITKSPGSGFIFGTTGLSSVYYINMAGPALIQSAASIAGPLGTLQASSWTCPGAFNLQTPAAASISALYATTGPYTGGTATTNFPYVYLNPGTTAPTNFSAAGTFFGINAATGFTGNFLHFAINGTRQFYVTSTGNLNCGTISSGAITAAAISGTTITGTGALKGTSLQTTGISTKTAAYTCTANDDTVLVNAASAAITITLEASTVVGQEHVIKKIDSSTNAVTVTAGGTVKIDGSTTWSTTTQFTAAWVKWDGTQWWLV